MPSVSDGNISKSNKVRTPHAGAVFLTSGHLFVFWPWSRGESRGDSGIWNPWQLHGVHGVHEIYTFKRHVGIAHEPLFWATFCWLAYVYVFYNGSTCNNTLVTVAVALFLGPVCTIHCIHAKILKLTTTSFFTGRLTIYLRGNFQFPVAFRQNWSHAYMIIYFIVLALCVDTELLT